MSLITSPCEAVKMAAECLGHASLNTSTSVQEDKEAGLAQADAGEAGWTQETVLCHINGQAVPYEVEVQATEAAETKPAVVSEPIVVFSNPVPFDDQSPTPMPINIVPGIA